MELIRICIILLIGCQYSARAAEQDATRSYDPEELLQNLFNNLTTSARQAGYGLIRFEGQSHYDHENKYGLLTFDGPVANTNPTLQTLNNVNADSGQNIYQPYGEKPSTPSRVVFQEDNRIEGNDEPPNNGQNLSDEAQNPAPNQAQKKRKRRRRRRPRVQQFPQYPGPWQGQMDALGNPGRPYAPGFPGEPFYRPRPRPIPPSDALTTLGAALTSIARHDDHQCVSRLLCEASTKGAPENSSLLSALGVLPQFLPLFTTSPLVVFGRGFFLGLASKNNPRPCFDAFPKCPTDPEDLVHYLNNHNGGLFRFFRESQLDPHNFQQFNNDLPGQYGLLPGQPNLQSFQFQPGYIQNVPNPGFPTGHPYIGPGPTYGLYQPNGMYPNNVGPSQYGLYPHVSADQQSHKYGMSSSNFYNYQQNYSPNYAHGRYNSNNEEYKGKDKVDTKQIKIEKRIQTRPIEFNDDDAVSETLDRNKNNGNARWHFPEESLDKNNVRGERQLNLKFPDKSDNNKPEKEHRNEKSFIFPGVLSNRQYFFFNPVMENSDSDNVKNNDFNNNYNVGVKMDDSMFKTGTSNVNNKDDEDGVRTLYIVRGNGDPNHPEIIKLRPGEYFTKK